MKYLITGGAGFIGSHLCDELLAQGHSVHVLDDLSTGSMANIRHLKGRPGFEYTIGSAGDAPLVRELIDEVDAVYHLAAAVGVALIVESPVRTIETNVYGTEVILSHANKKKRPGFVAATSGGYGKSADLPYRETGDLVLGSTTRGRWSYACSKAIDEFLALAYWKERKQPVVIGRLFNTVGPRQTGRYGMVIPNFVRQALAEDRITVFGDGSQSRCFCHVQDVVGAIADLMSDEAHYGEVFNVGSTEEIAIMDLAERVKAMTESSSEIVRVPYESAYEEGFEDMLRRVPDTTKLRERLGWAPTRTLREIVADVVEEYRTSG